MQLKTPFDLPKLPFLVSWALKSITRMPLLERWYTEWQAHNDKSASAFLDYVLDKIDRPYEVRLQTPDVVIPLSGPLVIVANHPMGALEGMMLARWLLTHRPDLKVVTNEFLLRFPEFESLFIGVDILGSRRDNLNAMKAMNRHIANDGALLVFPGGTVSELNLKERVIQDPVWHTTVTKLALKHDAWCLPVHVEGRNNPFFYISGLIHKRLRTLLLPRAMLQKTKVPVRMTVGSALKLSKTGHETAKEGTEYLRLITELIGANSKDTQPLANIRADLVAPAASVDHLVDYRVLEKGNYAVYCAPYDALGSFATHLAAQRERTFRAAGEGSGKTLDQDKFDGHYWHLFAWDTSTNQLVGAYRAIKMQDLLKANRQKKLYSYSLFNYSEEFFPHLEGAIEVGRSFVTLEYQRNPRALDLLWQGLGEFMIRNPDCHTFVGCVSISNAYAPLVRGILHDTLLARYRVDKRLHSKVKPVAKFSYLRPAGSDSLLANLASVSEINKLFGNAGLTTRVPVLIRHYLALNGQFVDFTVNHSFSQSLDGLILVDLRKAPPRYLKRYLGEQGAFKFCEQWRVERVA